MRKRGVDRFHSALGMLGYLVPAWLLLAVGALLANPVSPVFTLLANAVALSGICRALGFGAESQNLTRSGLSYFVLLVFYAAFVALLLVAPGLWLLRDGGLLAALILSAAIFLAVLAPWRLWPAFVLPFVWDDAYPRGDGRTSWLTTALVRSLAFARHLTGGSELFLAYGLPAGLSLFLLAGGCLVLDGLGKALPSELRLVAYVAYALFVMPGAHLLLVNRTLRVLMARGRAARGHVNAGPVATDNEPAGVSCLSPETSGADLDATLLCAAHSSQVELAIAALERGANPNASPPPEMRDQRSALMIAATLPDTRFLRALIAGGADVNHMQGGITPLISVTRDSYQGRPEAVMTLLANGADPRRTDADGNTPLHCAARCADAGIAALLLDAAADIDATNAEGLTALGVACGAANWPLAAFLLERGAKPDAAPAQPALLQAAGIADDDPAGVRLLLKQRANPDVRGPLERTPLMAAALAGHARIVDALLQAGADPNPGDRRGTTALIEAARAGSVIAIHALGKRKADVDAVDVGGRSALIVACQSRHASEEAVRALLSLGADRTLTDNDGKRALDHAAASGRWHVVALLDPEYPLPSNLGNGAPQAHEASIDHLLDALRFGHWNVVDEFTGVLDQWTPSALADLCFDLADAGHGAARDWLFNHGLAGDACLQDGRPLGEALLTCLPAATEALQQWMDRGAPIGGAGLVARVLEHATADDGGEPVRDLARALLARGGDWCGRGKGQRSALHLATALGDSGLIEDLLQRGADPNARDAHGRTPLHAVMRLDAERGLPLLRRLILAGADPEIATANGETALGLALARRDDDLARWLGWTTWHLPGRSLRDSDVPAAAALGDVDAVDRLLELGLPIDSEDAKGATALIHAAGAGHAALAVHLLETGANAAHIARTGVNCLAAAVVARREALVRTLLNHGVAPDMPLAGGATALMIAASLGNLPMVDALLEAGADPNAADEQGETVLHAAAQLAFDSSDTVSVHALLDRLLRAGADPASRNRAGQDALLVLLGARSAAGARCDGGHLARLAELLLGYGAKPDTQDQRGVGVLHACAVHGLFGCARMLKAHGAPLDLLDGFGRSAADVASLVGYADVAAELDASRQAMPSVRQTLRRPAAGPE